MEKNNNNRGSYRNLHAKRISINFRSLLSPLWINISLDVALFTPTSSTFFYISIKFGGKSFHISAPATKHIMRLFGEKKKRAINVFTMLDASRAFISKEKAEN